MKVRHPEFVLAGAVALSLPMVGPLLSGEISATAAATRFLFILIATWVFGSVLSWLINTYSEQARRAEITKLLQEAQDSESSANDDQQAFPRNHESL